MHEFFQLLTRNGNYRLTWTGHIVSEIGERFRIALEITDRSGREQLK